MTYNFSQYFCTIYSLFFLRWKVGLITFAKVGLYYHLHEGSCHWSYWLVVILFVVSLNISNFVFYLKCTMSIIKTQTHTPFIFSPSVSKLYSILMPQLIVLVVICRFHWLHTMPWLAPSNVFLASPFIHVFVWIIGTSGDFWKYVHKWNVVTKSLRSWYDTVLCVMSC